MRCLELKEMEGGPERVQYISVKRLASDQGRGEEVYIGQDDEEI